MTKDYIIYKREALSMKKVKRITPLKFRKNEQEEKFDELHAKVVDALNIADRKSVV